MLNLIEGWQCKVIVYTVKIILWVIGCVDSCGTVIPKLSVITWMPLKKIVVWQWLTLVTLKNMDNNKYWTLCALKLN